MVIFFFERSRRASTDLTKFLLFYQFWRVAWSQQDESRYLQKFDAAMRCARQAALQKSFSVCHWLADAQPSKIEWYDRGRYALSSALTIGDLRRIVSHAARVDTQREMTVAAIALKRYELRYDKPALNLRGARPGILGGVAARFHGRKGIALPVEC
jgi:hypothetical protein